MKVIDHRLCGDDGTPVPFRPSPNMGGDLSPRWLVMHYTAGGSASESINWLCNPAAQASAHLVIARDGTITQMVPFDRVAWHAGRSSWQGVDGLNAHSIGIELDNPGYLGETKPPGGWRYRRLRVGASFVHEGVHRSGAPRGGWHTYTDVQLRVAGDVAAALVAEYGLENVLGHDDVAPGRKIDPGPAFPMAEFRAAIMAPLAEAPAVPEPAIRVPGLGRP